MPKIREYKPSSSKSGYYIQANVGGSHPITIQVTSLAETILRQTGYCPGGSVPTKLVWAMYDLDLLFTESSLDLSAVKDISIDDILTQLDLGNVLSEAKKDDLISYIERYEGPQKSTLVRLKQELQSGGEERTPDDGKKKGRTEEISEYIPQTEDEAISVMFTMCSGAKEFRTLKRNINTTFLLRSLQTFLPHPHVDRLNSKVEEDGSIKYKLYNSDTDQTVWLKDVRGGITPSEGRKADYVISVPCESGEATAVISGENIVRAKVPPNSEYNIQDIERDLKWVLPKVPVKIDERLTAEYTHYDGFDLEPIRTVYNIIGAHLQIVEVDRISKNRNPVIEINGAPHILDRGKPGERYLAEEIDSNRWRVVSKVIQ